MANRLGHRSFGGKKVLGWLFTAIFAVMALTGFGQMPIFKRYYIADLPGMAWTADFYFTHDVHYVGASLLLALFAYLVFDHLLLGRKTFRLTATGHFRGLVLGAIVATGVFRVLKNLPDVVFSPGFTLFIDIAHLGFVMIYLLMGLLFLILRLPWVERKASL